MADQDPQIANPLATIMQIGAGLWASRALWAACRLRLADAVGEQPTGADDIADQLGLDPDMVGRLMKALAAAGIFACNAEGLFSHSALSRVLRSEHPNSMRPFVESVFGDEHYAAWGALDETVRTGTTAFESHYGMPVFAWFGQHSEAALLFSEAMTSTTRVMEAGLLGAHHLPDFELAVDIGGSRGTLLSGLLGQQPQARGILYDLPEIVEAARPTLVGSRIEAVAGDFFESVPAGGDLYLLKLILHDWTDAQCVTILHNIRSAIRPGGRVAIIENVLPETVRPHPGYLMDLNMMVMTGGRERTASEFAALLEQTGFRQESVTDTPAFLSIVEAVAVLRRPRPPASARRPGGRERSAGRAAVRRRAARTCASSRSGWCAGARAFGRRRRRRPRSARALPGCSAARSSRGPTSGRCRCRDRW